MQPSSSVVLDRTPGDVIVIAIEGEHDIATVPQLQQRFDQALDAQRGIVVDLTQATFLDSSVLGVVLSARKRALNSERGFAVCLGSSNDSGVKRLLEITGLIPIFSAVEERQQAIAMARGE